MMFKTVSFLSALLLFQLASGQRTRPQRRRASTSRRERELRGDGANNFIAVFDLLYETQTEGSDADVDEVSLLLDEAYNSLIEKYQNPYNIRMTFRVTVLSTDILTCEDTPEYPCTGTDRRQLQRTGRVRTRVTAGGQCSACGSSSSFTNQVSGRRKLRNEKRGGNRRLVGKAGGKGKGSTSRDDGPAAVPAPAPTAPAPAPTPVVSGTSTITNGPCGSTMVTDANGEVTVIGGCPPSPPISPVTPSPPISPVTTGSPVATTNSPVLPPADSPVAGTSSPVAGTSSPVAGTNSPVSSPVSSPVGDGTLINGLLTGLPSEADLLLEYNNKILGFETGNVIACIGLNEE